MEVDKNKRDALYVEGARIEGKNRFDLRKGTLRSFYEGATLARKTEYPAGYLTEERNKVVAIWLNENPVAVEWKLHPDSRIGITNYNENVMPEPIESCLWRFVGAKKEDSLALIAMDDGSKKALDELNFNSLLFDQEMLNNGIYVFRK